VKFPLGCAQDCSKGIFRYRKSTRKTITVAHERGANWVCYIN
jgi:hypothetical protein